MLDDERLKNGIHFGKQYNDYRVLKDAGKISAEVVKNLAEGEYEKFRVEQDRRFESDFDKEVGKYY